MRIRILIVAIFIAFLPHISRGQDDTTGVKKQANEVQGQIDALKTQISEANGLITKDQNSIGEVQGQIDALKTQIADTNDRINQRLVTAPASTPVPVVPQVPPQQPATAPASTPVPQVPSMDGARRVNILLIDQYGRISNSFKRVFVSDITRTGVHTHFLFRGEPVEWYQKVLFSSTFADSDAPVVGAIFYAPRIARSACKVVNIAPRDVYADDADGSVRYDDGTGKNFPCAPKGSGFTTAQQEFASVR